MSHGPEVTAADAAKCRCWLAIQLHHTWATGSGRWAGILGSDHEGAVLER